MRQIKNFIRKITPDFVLLNWREKQKKKRREKLENQRKEHSGLTRKSLRDQLESIGISSGMNLLVHSSLGNMGYVDGGAKTVVEVFMELIGNEGNLLMPSSSNPKLQLDFIRENRVMELDNSPSKMGSITEYFRKQPGVFRSKHPTEPVCAFGNQADYLTDGHLNELTPYTKKSPFYRLTEIGGKILYLGVTLDNAGTSLHLLEDNTKFEYPVYHQEIFDVTIKSKGQEYKVKTKVHNPEYSKKRKCDELIPRFIKKGVCTVHKIGEAQCLLFDAKLMYEQMINDYKNHGITMYTPNGTK